MKEEKTTLICTVGGSHQPILRAIEQLRPDHVCFVCSADDPATGNKGSYLQITGKGNVIKASPRDEAPTLPNIPTQAGLEAGRFEVLEVSPDDLDDVYRKTSRWLAARDSRAGRIVADYTGGTKSMSAGLVAAVLDAEGVDLQLVSGSRSNLVRVESGDEMVMPAGVEATRFERRFRQALEPWSRFAYEESLMALRTIPPPQDRESCGRLQLAIGLSEAFAAWDRFDHEAARDRLSRFRPRIGKQWGSLLGTLDLIRHPERGEPLRLFDLWRNAQRRAAQGRYDDAVARLYRLLEWSAQWILREEQGIDTSDVPPERIPEGIELTPNREGKFQAGLFQAWELAARLGGDSVRSFWETHRERMLDHIQRRNHSILAHGFEPLEEGHWRPFADWLEQTLLPLLLERSAREPYRIRNLPDQLPDHFGLG